MQMVHLFTEALAYGLGCFLGTLLLHVRPTLSLSLSLSLFLPLSTNIYIYMNIIHTYDAPHPTPMDPGFI